MCWLAGFARHHMQSSPEGDKVASTGPQQGRRCTKHREEKSMKKTVMSLAAAASLLAGVSMAAAEPVKVGMITTLRVAARRSASMCATASSWRSSRPATRMSN
jgi:hypothetical protein